MGRAEIGEAGTFEEVTDLLERGSDFDLILLDLNMPGVRGFSGLMYLRAQYPGLPIVVVTANDDPAPCGLEHFHPDPDIARNVLSAGENALSLCLIA